MFNGDYSYLATRKYGANFSIVGDAATFIDPILASGVFLSMNSARLVADGHADIFGKIMAERVDSMLAVAPKPPAEPATT